MAKKMTVLEGVGNDANELLKLSEPFRCEVEITGVASLLFHRWSNEVVAEKAAAKKGSKLKKTDDTEAMLYRSPTTGNAVIPSEYLRQSMIGAAKFMSDPRSPRKSMADLAKASILVLEDGDLGVKAPDFIDMRRVLVQRAAITRSRPGFEKGWKTSFVVESLLPEYLNEGILLELLVSAGKFIGLADFRPTFGRFSVTSFKKLNGE